MNQPEASPKAASDRAVAAGQMSERLLATLANERFDADRVERVVTALRELESSGSWDHATQRYLALVASQQSLDRLRNRVDSAVCEEPMQLRDFLQFPTENDSPRRYNPNISPIPKKP